MDTNTQAEMFFLISSVGFVVLWILVAIFLFYLIRATHTFSRIIEKIEKDVNTIGDTTKEMISELRDNAFASLMNFLFKKKKKKTTSKDGSK
ncbi:hypothetical protein HZA26_02330 [Candidatus Nomurabacteria bacterium]|nr:hypothetical protein [Candidatus Nomurabacteria bacterium]